MNNSKGDVNQEYVLNVTLPLAYTGGSAPAHHVVSIESGESISVYVSDASTPIIAEDVFLFSTILPPVNAALSS
jgi:hypothetical protein